MVVSRRFLIHAGFGLAARQASPEFRFATAGCEIEMSVEYHDRYSSRGFWFQDRQSGSQFCLSLRGEMGRNCAGRFVGSVAIAQYRIRPRNESRPIAAIREHVRTIDQDARLGFRAPVDRTLNLRRGTVSDIQAFGYEETSPPSPLDARSPWYYFRQDLYLDWETEPFLIVHWKHALQAIRLLDVIPGDGTLQTNP
jgi:hypothetical protein